jgi:threonine/homoserine/homoserine lactone efflux protein
MTPDHLLALALFAMVTSVTPGPNNMMMLASGVNFGFARSIPHLAGICLGFCFLLLAIGLGLQTVFLQFPVLQDLLRWGGGAYLVWMAWKLATSPATAPEKANSAAASVAALRPMGFWAAAAFQWINPKAWVMGIGAVTTYVSVGAGLPQLLLMVLVFGCVNLPCVACWAGFGSALRYWLQDAKKRRVFNVTMALLLLASLYPMLVK